MSDTWVLKFAQVDLPDQPILLHITKKNGHKLDLDLLATDVRGRNFTKQKSDHFDGTDEEWSNILAYVLVSKTDHSLDEAQRNNLEVTCSISGKGSKSKLLISFRTRIEDITHRLGAVELTYSENTDDVDLFSWTCQAIEQRDGLENQVSTVGKDAQSAQDVISDLQKQLDDLIQAKKEHENQLLSKFKLLLDEKNLKIRNQQRVLSTANVNQKTLDKIRSGMKQHTSDEKTFKRKRKEDGHNMADGEDESDGFEAMDVDEPADHNQISDSEGAQTEATETASEDEAGLDDPGSSKAEVNLKEKSSRAMSPPPPPRALPFQKKSAESATTKSSISAANTKMQDDADEETASENDEL